MFELPLSGLPFVVESDGLLRVETVTDLVDGKPFDDSLARGEGKLMAVRTSGGDDLSLMPVAQVGARFAAGTFLDIIWSDDEGFKEIQDRHESEPLATDDVIYLALRADAQAEIGASATFPTGPLSNSMGIKTGGSLGYTYLRRFHRSAPAGDVLRTFFRGLRLPQHAASPGGALESGEEISLQYGGYLQLGVAASFGYGVATSAEREAGRLQLRSRADVVADATARASLDVAGQWSFAVRQGREEGWARVIVRRQRASSFHIAADLKVSAEIDTEGLPRTGSEFLEAILDVHTRQMIGDVRTVLDDPKAFMTRVEAGVNDLTAKLAHELARRWLAERLTGSSAERLFDKMRDVVDAYDRLNDLAAAGASQPLAVLERYAGDADLIQHALACVTQAAHRSRFVQSITDSAMWELFKLYLGDRFPAFVTRDDVFEAVREELVAFAASGWEDVAAFIQARKEALGVDALLGEVSTLIDTAKANDSPEKLVAKAEAYLLEFMRRLTGKAFEELRGSGLVDALEELDRLVKRLEGFGEDLYAVLESAMSDSYRLEVSRSYTHATEQDHLIDVEINLEHREGPPLLQDALAGRFRDILADYDPALVKINPSVFVDRIQASSRLQLNVFGWTYASLRSLAFETRETVREQGGGLVHLYALTGESRIEQVRRDEETKMSLVLQLFADSEDEATIQTVSRMAAAYAYEIEDGQTTEKELREYLLRAAELEILPASVDDTIERLRSGLLVDGRTWGDVRAAYRVQYDPDALLEVFGLISAHGGELQPGQLAWTARNTFRAVVASHFTRFRADWPYYENLARVLLNPANYQRWKADGDDWLRVFVSGDLSIPVEGPPGTVPLSASARNRLGFIYSAEDRYVDALLELDAALDAARSQDGAPSRANLETVFQEFVRAGRELIERTRLPVGGVGGLFGEMKFADPFFAILDRLLALAGGRAARRAVLELDFRRGDETVSMAFTSGGGR